MDNYRIPRQRQPRVRVAPEEQFARLLEVHSRTSALTNADAGTARLLSVATALQAAGPQLAPPPLSIEARAAMRQRLVAVASVATIDHAGATITDRGRARIAESVGYRMRRRMVALAGSFTIVTGFAGVGVAAAHSLPGDPFYDVKRATESVQLWATHGDAAKGRLHLEFARTRLAEAAKLSPNSSHLASTLAAMNSQTEQGATELIAAYESSHSTQPLATLVTFSQQQYGDLTKLATTLPASLQPNEITALNVLTGVTSQVRTVSGQNCLTCLVTNPNGSKQHPIAPPPTSGTGPGQNPSGSSPNPQPSKSAGDGTSQPSTKNPTPTQTPSGLLNSLLPSNLQPSNLLPGVLGDSPHKTKQQPKPSLSPLPLISSLVQGLDQ